jgi:hypothetical protein
MLAPQLNPTASMKIKLACLVFACLSLGVYSTPAQPGVPGGGGAMGGPKGPNFSGRMSRLLGDNSAFSATLEMQTKDPSGTAITIPGKLAFHEGKSRMEMDLLAAAGKSGPETVAQMKQMGMGSMIIISRPEKKMTYLLNTTFEAYVEIPIPESDSAEAASKDKIEIKELGKDSVEGRDCTKNQVVATDDQGAKHEFTVWNASDLKKFPVKIETNEGGQPLTMLFKEVKFDKPDEALFSPPSSFKRYDSFMAMMMQEMMKRQGGGLLPPAR